MEENKCAICNILCVEDICDFCYKIGRFNGDFKCDHCDKWDLEGYTFRGNDFEGYIDICEDCVIFEVDCEGLHLTTINSNKPDRN